ncbi:hypothetical protein [Melioribacter sp. OK-6-Me]|uniref:tetratricopeptide repeat protein n=1 Tax=unclassified Melioribacter TaxID=2627329 RepID=UPI003ED98AEB
MTINRLLVIFLLSFLQLRLVAQTADIDFYSPELRLKFANYLYSTNDYLRALDEYKTYLKSSYNDTALFKYADCFFNMQRYEEAAATFKSLFFNSSLEDKAKLKFYLSNFLTGKFDNFRKLAQHEVYQPEVYRDKMKLLSAISYLYEGKKVEDTTAFFEIFPDSNRSEVKSLYYLKLNPPLKSELQAGLLSAFIPGAGKIYTGNLSDGVTSFIVTGLTAYLSVSAFQHNHKFRGYLFAGIATAFYAGNIYGSVASANIYNAKIRIEIAKKIKFYFHSRNYYLPDLTLQ